MRYVRGEGNPRARLMLIGDCPTPTEESPFSDYPSRFLFKLLEEFGITYPETYRTNVFKHFVNTDKKPPVPTDEELKQLNEEIHTIKPNCILAVGELALFNLTGMKKLENYRGSILQTRDGYSKVVPTYNPKRIDSRELAYYNRVLIRNDVERAVEESRTSEYRLPERQLLIAQNSLDLYRFLQENKEKKLVAVDIESFHCIAQTIAFAFSPYRALCIPFLNIQSGKNPNGIPQHDMVEMWKLICQLLYDESIKKIGQNFKYDHEKLRAIGMEVRGFEWDTMLMSHTLYPELPKSQGFLTSVFTRSIYYKDEGKEFNPHKDSFDRLYKYNAQDAAVDFEIYERLREELEEENLLTFYREQVHPLHLLYLNLEQRGIRVDFERRKELTEKYQERIKTTQNRLNELVGHEINVNSPKQMTLLLYHELKIPTRKDTGEDTIVALLANTVKDMRKKAILQGILDLRREKKTLSTYLLADVDFDNRMRTSYRITGTETGRSSSSVLKSPIRTKKCGLAFQTMTKHGDIGSELRSIFIPDPGFVFVEVDLSQAEARIVALLSEDEDLLQKFNSGFDVHRWTSALIFGKPMEKITSDERFIGKESRHAGNYNVGKRRFMQMVNGDAKKFGIPVEISEYRAGQILETFHSVHPKVKSVFHAQVQSCLQGNRTLINAYGRKREFLDRLSDQLYGEGYAQIPQSTVRDHMSRAMISILNRLPDTEYLLEAHDAFLSQVPIGEEKDRIGIYLEELEKEIDFSRCSLSRGRLRIPGEAKIGENYRDLVKFKV